MGKMQRRVAHRRRQAGSRAKEANREYLWKHLSEDLALPAYFHLRLPPLSYLALTDRPTNKPAKMAGVKFPCRTVSPGLHRTLPDHPTATLLVMRKVLKDQQKKDLALNVDGNIPPSLLKTLNGFERNTQ